MSVQVITEVHCEHDGGGCKEKIGHVGTRPEPRVLRAKGKAHGWSHIGGKDYCPDHKPTYKRVLVPAE